MPPSKVYRFWKVYFVCLLPDFWRLITVVALLPSKGYRKVKKVNLYRIYSIFVMLCVCGERCAYGVFGMWYSFCVEKCRSKRPTDGALGPGANLAWGIRIRTHITHHTAHVCFRFPSGNRNFEDNR
jgi:hypothetical protein